MMAKHPHRVVKKTLRLDPEKLARLPHLLQTTSASAALRQAIDETVAYREALQAAQRIQRRGTFVHDEGGVSNVDTDEINTLQIKAIGVTISTFETLPDRVSLHAQTWQLVEYGRDRNWHYESPMLELSVGRPAQASDPGCRMGEQTQRHECSHSLDLYSRSGSTETP
jgi:hypothetical protein